MRLLVLAGVLAGLAGSGERSAGKAETVMARQSPLPASRSPLPALRSPLPAPGSELTVTLLTYETGGLVFERFGHNAIWIHDSASGTDRHYDYGRFDFDQKNFFLRFAQGKMWYSMGEDSLPEKYIRFYASEGRKIRAQELDLTPAQRKELRDFLEWNIKPENAGYAYDYYLDNCSTRIRDALDRVLGGAIRRYAERPSGFTWRDETRRLDEHNPFLYSGLMLALGQPVDEEMSRWEQMFLPIRLSEHLDSVRVAGPDGTLRPVVKSFQVIAEGGRWPVPARPSNWTWRYLAVGLLLGGVLAWLGGGQRVTLRERSDRSGGAPSLPLRSAQGQGDTSGGLRQWLFLALATLWALLAGIAGLAVTWLSLVSGHRAAHQNENILLFNLLALALALVLPLAIRRGGRTLKAARRLALVVAALAALGLLLKLLPAFHQSNLELIALALPVHLGLWLGLRTREPS